MGASKCLELPGRAAMSTSSPGKSALGTRLQRCQNATWTWLEAQLDIIQALKFLIVKNS